MHQRESSELCKQAAFKWVDEDPLNEHVRLWTLNKHVQERPDKLVGPGKMHLAMLSAS